MKEKIVLDCEDILFSCLHDCEDNVGVINYKFDRRKVEKYPTTWEELKELCKGINDKYYKKFKKNKIYLIEEDFIEFMGDDMYGFRVDKDDTLCTLSSNDFDQVFKINQTPAQMWQIIKDLIGEE